jgi:hypothetical protein
LPSTSRDFRRLLPIFERRLTVRKTAEKKA